MSWQLATWVGVGVVVVGGFAWFERTRPPARLVALVAALAALAVAGRLVLAPVPNVVATTDIALITGFALGAAPGFAVGALAAPVSNIWLGQGPWTVWEMAGWGLVGLAGAALAAATGRRLGRVGLAAACGAAGLAYGALLDLSVMVTYGGEQSVDRYLALSARGMPFNVAHALGNVAFALAAGPALVRMVSRYQTRMRFTWRPAAAAPVALLVLATLLLALGAPDSARASDVGDARAYLVRSQNDDGGFAATRGQPSNPAMTAWVMLGLEAAGRNPLDVREGGETPVSYLRSQIGRVRSATDLERTILALEAAGLNGRDFGGKDLVATLRDRRDRNGSVDGQVNITAFWIVAMRAAGVEGGDLARSADWLRNAQNSNGGWGFRRDAPSDPDSTGAALQALGAAGAAAGNAGSDGVRYLRRSQRRSGGWALASSGVVNTQSTAWAVQGLLAAGARGEPLDRGLAHIAARRAGDGHYRYSATSDQTPVWVTAQAVMAAAREPLPLEPVPRKPKPDGGSGAGDSSAGTGGTTATGGAGGGTTSPFPASTPSPSYDTGSAGFGTGRAGGTPPAGDRAGPAAPAAPGLAPVAGAAEENEGPAERAARQVAAGSFRAAPAAAEQGASEGLLADDAELWLLGGLGGLGASLAGGFLWYRRRLP